MSFYILEGTKAVKVDPERWTREFPELTNRGVAWDGIGGVIVSTIFNGIDYRQVDAGPPLLFETMIFGGSLHLEMQLYSTWEEAERGHEEMVQRVCRNAQKGEVRGWLDEAKRHANSLLGRRPPR